MNESMPCNNRTPKLSANHVALQIRVGSYEARNIRTIILLGRVWRVIDLSSIPFSINHP